MCRSTPSCTFWAGCIMAACIMAAVPEEETVQVLDKLEPLPSLKTLSLPNTLSSRHKSSRSSALPLSIGEAEQSADAEQSDNRLPSDTRAEEAEDAEAELQALHKEDHDAEIKAIAEAEHIKATERAKRGQTVPEDVTCYHELDSAAKQQQALADRLGEEAEKAAQSLKQATYLKEKAATDTQKFKIRMDSDHKMKTDAETQYKSEHSVALNAFEAARGNLDSYNNDRKKVDLDSTRSKQILAKYLDYKKKFIQANADSDDPTQSKEVVQYRLLSEKYLKEYHSLQVKMQQNYASATHESEQYQELSQRYQRIAGDANDIAAEVTKTSGAFTKSSKEHARQHEVYLTQEKEAQRWEGILAQTKEDAKAARASYSKLKKHEEASKINYLKLRSMAVKYGEMGKDAETTTDLNRMRMLNFEQESKSFAREITAGIAAVSVLKRKYETADSAGMLYTKTWRAGGCESATAKKDTDPEVPDKLQSDEPVVTKYSPTECASDKHIATQNLEGAAAAKLAHLTELAHLTSAKENHANAVTGAKTAKSIMAFTKVKSKRYLKVAKSALKQSADPCDS